MSRKLFCLYLSAILAVSALAARTDPPFKSPKLKPSQVARTGDRPKITPQQIDQLIGLLQLAKAIQTRTGNGEESQGILSSVASHVPGLSTLTTASSAGYSTLTAAASGVTYFLYGYLLEPIDRIGIRSYLCSSHAQDSEPEARSAYDAFLRSSEARFLADGLAQALNMTAVYTV
ncbi:hypothetical protein HDE_03694 [Halotydeus destructor]|nr:hypothetical protein HDE_03694 [Halotydeus destructor]